MGNSLKDQLLKLGLVTEEQVRRAESAPSQKHRQRPRKKGEAVKPVLPRPAEPKPAPPRPPKEDKQARKERDSRIAAYIERCRLNDPKAEIAYHFLKGRLVKRIYVTTEQNRLLSSGSLAITAFKGFHHIIAADAVAGLREISPEIFIYINDGQGSSDEDYGDHPIPDDLIW